MKKLFTLLVCTGLASASFGQSDRDRAADVILRGGNNSSTASYPTGGSNCQDQINAVNRNYDAQVAAMRSNGNYTASERDYKISQIEQARRTRLNEVRRSCGGTRSGTHSRTYKGNKAKVKGNNGNHYGWEKGKGNPHRSGGKWKGKED
ncbi:MAG: hypothetical protein EOO16_24255 [Chitinophagaceae bacterium]|nr:MAG: hypothetical protein EOO16_24255 [Chitinophagaceae bacterium]